MDMMVAEKFCYHCGTRHPQGEMKRIVGRRGVRWRCKASLEAVRVSQAERDRFGRQITAANSAEISGRLRASREEKRRTLELVGVV